MSDREKYLYDLQGFLVMKDFLSQEEVKAINDAWGVRNTTERCGRCPTEPCRDSTFRTLARGYHLGFVGPSDGHNVMPGQSCISGGYAPELTRGAIFAVLKARRTYATSGTKIKLNFAINDFFMGR